MDTQYPLPLFGGMSPAQFMRRHWQKKPLLVRQAVPEFAPPVLRADLFALAGQEGVESRLVQQIIKGRRLPISSPMRVTSSRYVNVSGPIALIITFSRLFPCSTANSAKSST